MSRSTVYKKEDKKKQLNPIWRGIGCLFFIFAFVTSFLLASYLIDRITASEDPLVLPAQLGFVPSALRVMTNQFRGQFPWFGGIGKYIPPAGLALVIALFMYGIAAILYATFRGDISDPHDVRNWQPGGRKKRNVRRCR